MPLRVADLRLSYLACTAMELFAVGVGVLRPFGAVCVSKESRMAVCLGPNQGCLLKPLLCFVPFVCHTMCISAKVYERLCPPERSAYKLCGRIYVALAASERCAKTRIVPHDG